MNTYQDFIDRYKVQTMENYLMTALQDTVRMTEQDRLEKFRRNWEIYYGKGQKPLKVAAGAADDNLRMNFGRMFIDKGVAFLFGKDVGFELAEGETTPEEDYLDQVWQANRKMSLLQKLATSGAVCGTAFVKIHWKPGMDPRLIICDPETVSVTLAEDDIDRVVAYKIRYPSVDPVTKKPIAIQQLIEQDGAGWMITDQRGNVDGGSMQTVGEQRWPYTFSPVVHCQNMIAPHEFWGMSDIEDDLVEAIDKENFTVSNILKILRYHAHPKTWARGVGKADVRVNADELILLPNDNSTLQNLEMQSDLVSSIQMHKELKQFVHELARVPEVATGKVESIGQLSGVALEILYQPLIEKTEAKRVTYGEMIVELNRRLLALGGYGDDNLTELRWQEMLPKDAQIQANAALSLKQLGVSGDTLIQEFGYDPDVERGKKSKELVLGQALMQAFDQDAQETE